MSIINVISAIGNNASICPLIVRDCGIEVPAKIAMTYNQNLKESKQMAYNATRERFIDEYGTSVVWLGGIPAMNALADWGMKKLGYNPKVNIALFNENEKQGIKLNIEKFRNIAPKEVKDLEKVLKNKTLYQKLQAGKFLASTIIPTIVMGYILPKCNFALTNKLAEKQKALAPIVEETLNAEREYELGAMSFKGISASLANMSNLKKMALTDGGLTIGRVGTSRNKYERIENGFKMSMMMFLNFIAPAWIAKGLNKFSGTIFKTNVNLDPMLLNDKNFIKEIKEGTLEIPNSNYIEYMDKNPNSTITKLCEKYCGVKFLENRVRDPRYFVNEQVIEEFLGEIRMFSKEAIKSKNIQKYAKTALIVKSANILANVGISSFLLAVILPKITFMLRKKITGSDADPGLVSLSK